MSLCLDPLLVMIYNNLFTISFLSGTRKVGKGMENAPPFIFDLINKILFSVMQLKKESLKITRINKNIK